MTSDARARRTILITGVSGEIGSYLAGHFAQLDWLVLGVDKQTPARAMPAGTIVAQCDLADGAAATAALDTLVRDHGVPDVLVNGAGLIANAPLVRLVDGEWVVHDFDLWDRILASSLTAAFHASAVCVKHMLATRKKGVLINLSSVSANGTAGQSAYSSAKAGVEGLTRALAKELGPFGIRAVALALGYFDTASMHANVPEARLAKVVGSVPLKRLGTLPDVAGAVDFIIANPYTNGTTIRVDGGLVV
jgi:3-oxoacyl-[acyl-carrier protein] reductase